MVTAVEVFNRKQNSSNISGLLEIDRKSSHQRIASDDMRSAAIELVLESQ